VAVWNISRPPYNDVCKKQLYQMTDHSTCFTTNNKSITLQPLVTSTLWLHNDPILCSSTNLSDQQLGPHCWDWVYPMKNMQINRYHYSDISWMPREMICPQAVVTSRASLSIWPER